MVCQIFTNRRKMNKVTYDFLAQFLRKFLQVVVPPNLFSAIQIKLQHLWSKRYHLTLRTANKHLKLFVTLISLAKTNLFSLRISLYSILLCPILNYCILFYSILFYSTILYYKSTSLSLSLSRLLIPSLKQLVKVVPLSRIGFLSFK